MFFHGNTTAETQAGTDMYTQKKIYQDWQNIYIQNY